MIIKPHPLCGSIAAIPSKSDAHRAIICALLAKSVCKISPIILSNDILATINAAKALGAVCTLKGDALTVDSTGILQDKNKPATIDCAESGSTLRFMLAVTAALGAAADFVGSGRLPLRPIDEFFSLFPAHGVTMSENHLPLSLSGGLTCGEYKISGNVSSQYITGLLLSLPILPGDSRITLTTKLESKPYIDMTIRTMNRFGVYVTEDEHGFTIKGSQQYKCGGSNHYTIDGDWSQAAFFLTAGVIGGDILMSGLSQVSAQGDKAIFDIIRQFGGNISFENGLVAVKKSELKACDIDASQIPDLVPAIAVMAAFASGTTHIYGAGRLRFKESDRIKSVTAALTSFGVDVTETDDGMIINGSCCKNAVIDCCNDHRIAMAFAVMAAYCENDSELLGDSCVNKSYPAFFEDFTRLQKGI